MDELIIRVLSGQAEPLEERRLLEWRAEAPANDQHFHEVATVWAASLGASESDDHISPPPAVESIVRDAEAMRRREERDRFTRGFRRRENWPWAAAAVLAAVSLGVWIGRGAPGGELGGTEFVAGGGEATTVALSDGSFVRLEGGSSVRFAGDGETREAWLTGRAFFGVASDPERPFVVHTDLADTRVLGTRFEVSSGETDLRVVVVEGTVRVTSDRGQAAEVTKGQVATVAANGDFSVRTVEDLYELLDWEAGILVFQGTPLEQVAEEVAAHFGVEVTVGDEMAQRTLTAWFGDDSLNEVAESICLLVQAECEIGPDAVRIRD